MLISIIAAKLNIQSLEKRAEVFKKRTSLERVYGKTPSSCKTSEQLCEWHMQRDPYMAEFFTE